MGNKPGKGDASSPQQTKRTSIFSSKQNDSNKSINQSNEKSNGTNQSNDRSNHSTTHERSSPLSIPNGHQQANGRTEQSSSVDDSQTQITVTAPSLSQSGAELSITDSQSQANPAASPGMSPTAPIASPSSSLPSMVTLSIDSGPVSIRTDPPLSRIPLADGQDSFGEAFRTSSTTLSVDDFDLLKVIGKGSFGKVMQVRKRDNGKIYAMKVLKKEQLIARKQVAHTKTERKVLEEISSPFIVGLRYAFQTENKLYMILDYFTGGELFFHLKAEGRFTEDRARFYAAEMVLALEVLHKNTIAYRDLKPENVLLDMEGHIRLTDFGLSKEGITATQLTHTFCGTPEYLAPEVVQGQHYGLPVDWWSLGTILYEMLTGLPPFYDSNLHIMYEKIVRARVTYPPYLSFGAKALLSALLERDPARRLGSNGDAAQVKAHPFFASIDWVALANRAVPAPFIPQNLNGRSDTSNIDEEFTRETPRDTPIIMSNLRPGSQGQQVSFPGFTYFAPSSVGLQSNLSSNELSAWH